MKNKHVSAISTQDEFLKFVESLSAGNSKKGKTRVKVTVTDLKSLDLSVLRDLDETIHLSGVNIELNLIGDVGPYSAALLGRRYKRTGFAGRNISLAIPASVSSEDRTKLIDRIGLCAEPDSTEKVKTLAAQGASVTMNDAKTYGLIDQVIDLSKRRGKPKTAVAASEGNSAPEKQIATS